MSVGFSLCMISCLQNGKNPSRTITKHLASLKI